MKRCRTRYRPATTALTIFRESNALANSYATKSRPPKPYPAFPLFGHDNGRWCRKIRGKVYSFGGWDDPDYVFITKARNKWSLSTLPSEFRKLIDTVNVDDGENELGSLPIEHGTFGYFRHTFETIAGGRRDQIAVNAITGNVDDSMSTEYRASIDDLEVAILVDRREQQP